MGNRSLFPAGERSEPRSRTAPKGLPQTEAWAERERVPSGHNCRRQLATDRPEQIQGPGTAVPGTPIFANYAKRGGPQELPCRVLSLVLSFASKESTAPLGAAAPSSAPESARQAPDRKVSTAKWPRLVQASPTSASNPFFYQGFFPKEPSPSLPLLFNRKEPTKCSS